jgi:N-acyl-D-aspartate/D-glutamate deacylase
MRLATLIAFFAAALCAQTYDIVIANGRVMDPESSLDAIRNVGIRGHSIAAISGKPLQGRTVIDAKGLVVAPGFIDLHSHGQALPPRSNLKSASRPLLRGTRRAKENR